MPGVLIADDRPSIRDLLRTYVEDTTPFKVCGEATNGLEAIELAKQLNPDVVLLDVIMPMMNGAEACRILKNMMPNLRVIMFTFYAENVATLATTVGADLVFSKTDSLRRLAEYLRALMPAPNVLGNGTSAPTA